MLIAALAAPRKAPAQEQSPLDPSVTHVVSGGTWRSREGEGTFRVVVRNQGWEHVSSRLTVEWLAANQDSRSVTVLRSQSPAEISEGRWSLGAPQLIRQSARWMLLIEGTNPYTLATRRWRFALGPPGVVTVQSRAPAG